MEDKRALVHLNIDISKITLHEAIIYYSTVEKALREITKILYQVRENVHYLVWLEDEQERNRLVEKTDALLEQYNSIVTNTKLHGHPVIHGHQLEL